MSQLINEECMIGNLGVARKEKPHHKWWGKKAILNVVLFEKIANTN